MADIKGDMLILQEARVNYHRPPSLHAAAWTQHQMAQESKYRMNAPAWGRTLLTNKVPAATGLTALSEMA